MRQALDGLVKGAEGGVTSQTASQNAASEPQALKKLVDVRGLEPLPSSLRIVRAFGPERSSVALLGAASLTSSRAYHPGRPSLTIPDHTGLFP